MAPLLALALILPTSCGAHLSLCTRMHLNNSLMQPYRNVSLQVLTTPEQVSRGHKLRRTWPSRWFVSCFLTYVFRYVESTYDLKVMPSHVPFLSRAIRSGADQGIFSLPKGMLPFSRNTLGMTDTVQGVTGRIKLASKVKTVRVVAVNEVFNYAHSGAIFMLSCAGQTDSATSGRYKAQDCSST